MNVEIKFIRCKQSGNRAGATKHTLKARQFPGRWAAIHQTHLRQLLQGSTPYLAKQQRSCVPIATGNEFGTKGITNDK